MTAPASTDGLPLEPGIGFRIWELPLGATKRHPARPEPRRPHHQHQQHAHRPRRQRFRERLDEADAGRSAGRSRWSWIRIDPATGLAADVSARRCRAGRRSFHLPFERRFDMRASSTATRGSPRSSRSWAIVEACATGVALATTGTGISTTRIISVGSLDLIRWSRSFGHKVEIATEAHRTCTSSRTSSPPAATRAGAATRNPWSPSETAARSPSTRATIRPARGGVAQGRPRASSTRAAATSTSCARPRARFRAETIAVQIVASGLPGRSRASPARGNSPILVPVGRAAPEQQLVRIGVHADLERHRPVAGPTCPRFATRVEARRRPSPPAMILVAEAPEAPTCA